MHCFRGETSGSEVAASPVDLPSETVAPLKAPQSLPEKEPPTLPEEVAAKLPPLAKTMSASPITRDMQKSLSDSYKRKWPCRKRW